MKIKKLSVGIAGIFLFVASGLPQTAYADKTITMDLRFAGAFVTNSLPSALIHAAGVGSPGRVEIRGYGGVDQFVGFTMECLGTPGPHIQIDILENPLLFRFNDLSLLFAKNGNGTICISMSDGSTNFVINIMFDGGRGRYAGATGNAVITGEAEALDSGGTFLAETGTIVGTIHLP
ncbi:MAG: hypothetical protein IH838_05740 [Proteobacteria bacterium]|nr:hypothetical protein [Pseudomonadota bacterium]